MNENQYKYFAFISYSRKDSCAAEWLQGRLEWFRFPVKLVNDSCRPPHLRYVRPVYRDKTNLEVDDAHYWDNIKKAIDQSRFLVVLCSPNSATSEPVDRECQHFLNAKERKNAIKCLVPVILNGSVNSRDGQQCLCPAILALGATITDRNLASMVYDGGSNKGVSSEKDAWEEGFIGVASYLLNLSRESLSNHVRREERKRAVWARSVAALFAVLTTVAVGAGVYAWSQKELAIKSQAQTAKALQKSQQSLSAEYFRRGQASIRDHEPQSGLAYLAAALRANPANRSALLLTQTTLMSENIARLIDPGGLPWTGQGRVTQGCFSSSGHLLAVANERGNIWVWDVAGQCLKVGPFSVGESRIASLAFSPNERLLVTNTTDDITLFSIDSSNTAPCSTKLSGEYGTLMWSGFTRSNEVLINVYYRGVEWRDAVTLKRRGSTKYSSCPLFTVDQELSKMALAYMTDSGSHEVGILDLNASQDAMVKILNPGDLVYGLGFLTKNGTELLTWHLDKASSTVVARMQVWDTLTGNAIGSSVPAPNWSVGIAETPGAVTSYIGNNGVVSANGMLVSPDCAVVLLRVGNACQAFIAKSGQGLKSNDPFPQLINAAVFDQTGGRLMIRSGRRIRVWSTYDWSCCHEGALLEPGDTWFVPSQDFCYVLALGSGQLWDMRPRSQRPVILWPGEMSDVVKDTDDMLVREKIFSAITASGLTDQLCSWDLSTAQLRQPRWSMPSTSRVSQVLGKYDFTADDKNASGTSDTTRPGALVAGSKDGTLCLCYRSGEIALYRHPGFELIAKANVDETPVNAAFSDDARLVAVADASGEVIVYLVKDLVKMRQFTGTLSVRTSSPALEFSENNRVLLVGDPMQCSVWNIESGKKLFESRPTMANNTPSSNSWRQKFGHNSLTVFQPGTKAVYADSDRGQEQEFTCSAGSFSCYAVSRPHSLLAVGDTGGHVVVYHLTTGNRVAGPFPVNGVVHDMQFIGDEQVIVTLSGTPAELNLWSTEGQNWLGSLGSFTKANRLTTGGGKNHVILWDGHAELSLGGSFIRVLSLPLFDFEQSEIEVLAGCTEAIASCRVVDGAGSAERYVPQCPFLTTHIKRSQPMKDRVSVWFQWLLSEYEDRMIAPGAEFGPQYWMSLWEERYIKRPHGIPEEGLIEDFLAAEPNDPRVLIKGAELWAAEANRSQSAIGNLALKKAAHIVFLLKHGPATEQVSERISFVEYLLETAQR